MLILQETVGFGFSRVVERTVRCEHCFAPISVWTHISRICPHCRGDVPNVIDIQEKVGARIKFHFSPEEELATC